MDELNLHAGDWVEVRSKEEILNTLDSNGQLEKLPFMPPMLKYCGKRFRVYKRAHKTCDTVNDYKGRRMHATVHLEGLRCHGEAHEGCQALCLLYWKESWLKKVPGPVGNAPQEGRRPAKVGSGCNEEQLWNSTKLPGNPENPTYVCQATQVPAATSALPWWHMRQYVEDYTSGNETIWQMFKVFCFISYYNISRMGIGLGRPMRWFYDRFQSAVGGLPYPRKTGNVPAGQRTPTATLNLQPGELVRVKSYEEVLATLDADNKNRGLYFDAEVVPYCGKVFRVVTPVSKIINERTSKMIRMRDSVILENVVCQSRYSNNRLFCPRALYQFMREIWLERVSPAEIEASNGGNLAGIKAGCSLEAVK